MRRCGRSKGQSHFGPVRSSEASQESRAQQSPCTSDSSGPAKDDDGDTAEKSEKT